MSNTGDFMRTESRLVKRNIEAIKWNVMQVFFDGLEDNLKTWENVPKPLRKKVGYTIL